MKISKTCIAFLLALCLCASGALARAADEMWSEEYYRVEDYSGDLTREEKNALDEDCISFIETYHLDLVLLAVTERQLEDTSASRFVQDQYETCGFGYGMSRDGFVWLYNVDEERVELFCFGAARNRIAQDYIDRITGSAVESQGEYGVSDVLSSGVKYLSAYLDEHPEEQRGAADGEGMPDWYPDDPKDFVFYHDETAPRVVDRADIFSDEEEQRMEARLGEIRREIERDIVIYTDTTDYGLSHSICAADFYDFNGYGCGDGYEGACLFICMDPADRGWWCACSGDDTRARYTEDIANLIDDALYEYMAGGAYGDGVANWIENIRRMYIKGHPFAPEWYSENGATAPYRQDPDAPRVVDEIGLLTQEEVDKLSARAAEISQKYGTDVAIHTMLSPWGMDFDDVARQYYAYMGYGVGEDYSGILLTVFKREGYYAASRLTAFGSTADKLNDVNYERLWDSFKGGATEDHYYRGASQWLRQVDHLLRTGRVARSTAYWVMICLFGLLCGAIFAGVSLGRAKKKMAPPKVQSNADDYYDSRTSHIGDAGRTFLYATTTRRYVPRESSSSGSSRSSGGSSHRSSYSHSYRGSSGRSHSGSGRRF